MSNPLPIGSVLDIPGHGKFLVVGHDQDGKEQLKYVGSPTKPKVVKGWTPSVPVNPYRVRAAKRPRTASRGRTYSRTRRRTYPRAYPVDQKKQHGAAGWIVVMAVLLFFGLLGSCNETQSRRLPDFITGHHGR